MCNLVTTARTSVNVRYTSWTPIWWYWYFMEKIYFTLWRKSISHACTICDLQDNRLLGIDIDTNDGKLFILNVYLPYQSSDNFEEFCNYLGKIASIIEEKDTSTVVITGNFNAAVNTPFESDLIAVWEYWSGYLRLWDFLSNVYVYVCKWCSQLYLVVRSLYLLSQCKLDDHWLIYIR